MRSNLVAVGAVVLLVVLTRAYVVDTVWVASDSMAPTVCAGDVVLVSRLAGGVGVDDLVTFPSPKDGSATVKRVVAVEGQSVAIRDAELVVADRVVAEPYVDRATIDGVYFGPVTVPAGSVFVLGDQRETSIDSRAFGAIPRDSIDGRLVADLWSTCQAAKP